MSETITADWLKERGGLHDARVTSVVVRDSDLIVEIDDEWANENDGDPKRPGVLEFTSVEFVTGDLDDLAEAWITDAFLNSEGGVQIITLEIGRSPPPRIASTAIRWISANP